MGEYRTPGAERWTPWIGVGAVLAALAGILLLVPAAPLAGLLGWLFALAGFAAYILIRAWFSWRRVPTVIRLGQHQLTVRRGDGSVMAEIPYAAIAAIKDRFWSDSLVVHGTDGTSRIEISLATLRIRELLIALADQIPPYLWDLESARRFAVPFPWMFTAVLGISYVAFTVCAYLAGWIWLTALCVAGLVSIAAYVPFAVRIYEISRTGVTILRLARTRFVPAAEIASVRLKRGTGRGPVLYVSLLLKSGKQVGLMKAEQSAVVLYRTLLDMQKVQA
ncbi:MAG: hypothetical protein JWN73_2411 [Betaproteobacteria bacterium]|nr:hypothetical protein [Betaproteobacteria bacterium]